MTDPKSLTREQLEAEVQRRAWFHTMEIAPGLWTKGHYTPSNDWLVEVMELPKEMSGMTALDMGCSDGAHAFGFARRGATVTAVDLYSPDGQNVEFLARLWDLPVTYQQSTVYQFRGGPYDLVLAGGLLYHLQHPLLGLQVLNSVCRDTLVLESHIISGWGMVCKFYPRDELAKDPSNWWGPTKKCLLAMVESCGFEVVKAFSHTKGRMMIKAKKVREVSPDLDVNSVHMRNYGVTPF